MIHSLGSHTSGVDGSSEGGRINTINVPGTLVLYGVALIARLQHHGYRGKLSASPIQVEGRWCLEVVFDGDAPDGVPELWHGHRVMVHKAEPAHA